MEVVALKNSQGGPDHLSEEAKSWWGRLVEEYALADDAAHLLLQTALEAFDRMRGCQAAIQRDGATVPDRFGQHKPHPLLAAERDSRAQMLAALKAMIAKLTTIRVIQNRADGRWNNATPAASATKIMQPILGSIGIRIACK